MYRLARHQTATEHEQSRDRMKFEHAALGPRTQRQVLQDPALADPVGHKGGDAERRGDRRAFEILALAAGVLGHVGHGDVEARQARKAAEHEEGEEDVIDGSAQAERKGGGGGGHTERDQISQRIQFLAHETALLPPARDLAIHKVEEEAEGHEG